MTCIRYALRWFVAGFLVGLILCLDGAPLWVPLLYGGAAAALGAGIWIKAWRATKREAEQEIDELFETLKRKARLDELRGRKP